MTYWRFRLSFWWLCARFDLRMWLVRRWLAARLRVRSWWRVYVWWRLAVRRGEVQR